jgi:NAD(P)-dependent dehydrogenase (short-subunit alcohol dehydrogenase family)
MEQKIVLITGISSGFGKSTAEFLAQKGYIIYGTSRKTIEVDNRINVLKADVTDIGSVKAAVETILNKEGRIDILINNAGMGISGPIEFASTEDFNLQMDTNFIGVVNMIQSVLPAMRKQKEGTIVNISSIGGLMGLPFQGFYSASKYAIEGMSEALRMELKPFHIKVVVVRPGDFHTGFHLQPQGRF